MVKIVTWAEHVAHHIPGTPEFKHYPGSDFDPENCGDDYRVDEGTPEELLALAASLRQKPSSYNLKLAKSIEGYLETFYGVYPKEDDSE
jgi:hypothetical protein